MTDFAGAERRRGGPDRRNPELRRKILIVDDHALFRVGIRNILERESDFEIVAEADDARSAFDMAVQTSPDIVLMDLSLPSPGGVPMTKAAMATTMQPIGGVARQGSARTRRAGTIAGNRCAASRSGFAVRGEVDKTGNVDTTPAA